MVSFRTLSSRDATVGETLLKEWRNPTAVRRRDTSSSFLRAGIVDAVFSSRKRSKSVFPFLL
jgi:hypothetical protein